MTSQGEDYSDLLATLDEILQEEHDVEIAASAKAIRALVAENKRLREAVAEAVYMLDPEAEDVLKGAGIYRIVSAHVAAGGVLPGDLKDALAQISTQEGEE